ncbi:fungal-specific transcription factor domain-containing protein [Mucidula mucida]|nr:fungal-specific transcription factor domain-containing protein [Mucidula mucida]
MSELVPTYWACRRLAPIFCHHQRPDLFCPVLATTSRSIQLPTMASRHDRSASKKRRLTRACDMCKRKKIRCDGVEMPGNQCTNCLNSKVHCTHVEVLRNLGTAKGYVESLERRLQKLTQLFKKLLPEVDIDQELDDTEDSIDEENERTTAKDEETSILLSYAVNRTLNFAPQRQRYFGKSNALFLIQAVAAQRAHYLGKHPSLNPSFSLKQGEHWAARPWYNPRHRYPTQEYEFPEEDLLKALIDAYFEHENCFLPLLHRPMFEKALQDQVHYHDEMFGGTVLMVCALGARWVDDRRVFTEGVDMAGWSYFDQISLPPPPDGPVSLGEMQMYCLYITYHQLIPTARTMWIYLGTAFRLIQDAGMHMRSPNPPNAQDELWKRVFWCLMFLDISYASVFGHTPTLNYEMFDIDYPIECDDEYWENDAFAQPKDTPSSISFFVQLMKLMQILSYILRVTYAVRRPLHVFTANRLPEAQILAGFDSSLNEWQAALPDSLRWDPRRREESFFRQSAFLHITMYYVQIQAHRPYIPGPDQKHSVMPSLAICSNAALSCMRIVETQKYRGYIENVHILAYLYPAAMILLLRAWSVPVGDTLPSATQEMKFVQVCLDMFKRCQKRPNAPPAFIFW